MIVYKLEGEHRREQDVLNDTWGTMFLIGFFGKAETCERLSREYKRLPGFCEESCAFHVTEYLLECEAHAHVFYLQHEYEDDRFDIVTEIGLYATEAEAVAAREEILGGDDPEDAPLREHPGGFCIDRYEVDGRPEWGEGFTSD